MELLGMKTRSRQQIEEQLTEREVQILKLMASGSSRGEISRDLDISVLTYDEHRKNIRNKLGLKSHVDWALTMIPYLKKN